jgi:hypothetical protein
MASELTDSGPSELARYELVPTVAGAQWKTSEPQILEVWQARRTSHVCTGAEDGDKVDVLGIQAGCRQPANSIVELMGCFRRSPQGFAPPTFGRP